MESPSEKTYLKSWRTPYYHQERNHQDRDNLLLFPIAVQKAGSRGAICCRERLAGLLKYSHAA
jgi:hypothetical protein